MVEVIHCHCAHKWKLQMCVCVYPTCGGVAAWMESVEGGGVCDSTVVYDSGGLWRGRRAHKVAINLLSNLV